MALSTRRDWLCEEFRLSSVPVKHEARPPTWFPLTSEQTAPYVAFQGARATILAEESPACGQRGRVRRVFWRQEEPWVALRCQNGLLLSLPWHWTDLPTPGSSLSGVNAQLCPVLLAPQTLVELVRFVRYHADQEQSPRRGEKGRHDDSRTRPDRLSPSAHERRQAPR